MKSFVIIVTAFYLIFKFGYGINSEEVNEQDEFFKTYLSDEYMGKNSYRDKSEFRTRNLSVPPEIEERFQRVHTVYGYWLPNTTCYGVTLPSNETVSLDCLSNDSPKHLQQGCFTVSHPQINATQDQTVCVEVWRKSCIGIVTPMNWFVEFACHPKYYRSYSFSEYDSDIIVPKIGNCYEIYDPYEEVTPYICQRPANPEKQSCVHLIAEEKSYGLKTPTNETILLREESEPRFVTSRFDFNPNVCLNILRPDKSYKKVCLQKFGNYSMGVITPDNFTVLFDSYFCSTFMTNEEREEYKKFINSFTVNPEIKRCYKIYSQYQEISPYTCLNEKIFTSCIQELPHVKNCEGIITQNNETVVLNCIDGRETLKNHSCFEIYTANNSLHVACQKRVEERCIGITTPSNLTVLLDCYFCDDPSVAGVANHTNIYTTHTTRRLLLGVRVHNVPYLGRSWKFMTTYFRNELLGRHSYLGKLQFRAVKESNQAVLPIYKTVYGHWLPNSDCYGLTLDSNETIVLDCISKDRFKHIKSGCFPVIGPNTKREQIVCSKILDAECIGITTTVNWTVALACYFEYYYKNFPQAKKISYKERPVDDFTLHFTPNDCYEFYYSQKINADSCRKSTNPKNYACVHWLTEEKRCLGLRTPNNETIELVCKDSGKERIPFRDTYSPNKNCFHIYNSTDQTEVCLQKFGDFSVGVTTSSNYSILFDSFLCPASKTPVDIKRHKEFIDNFTFDPSIRSCYKVYTSNQDINPYTCLSNEVYDACIHSLENTACMGITTQNNETVILECSNGTKVVDETGCFKIYTPDNNLHTACQKQVDELCMGITTPSNLTVLLECYSCQSTKGGSVLSTYTSSWRNNYRPLLEYFLYSFIKNNYVLDDKKNVQVYTPEQDIIELDCFGEVDVYDIHELHGHDNCRGITLNSSETIVLGCRNKKPETPGCFDVFSPTFDEDNKIVGPEQKVANLCIKILNEWCVGITTPKNWTVPFSCYTTVNTPCGIFGIPYNGPPNVEIV